MRISTKGEYALKAMLELGMRNGDGVSIREIAQQWDVSLDYLEQIMPILRKAGLVSSKRGAKGGYALIRPAQKITVAEIVQATEGGLSFSGDAPPSRNGSSTIDEVWKATDAAILAVLKRVTLAELVDKERAKRARAEKRQLYAI